jgi:hypothetical protein
MNSKFCFLLVVIFLVACSETTELSPTERLKPTTPLEPTATPTKLVATEIPPSPSPVPTDRAPATPTQRPTDTPLPILFNFTWYENNPILSKGDSGEWDNIRILEGKIVLIDDVFHMFYTGIDACSAAIGYAVSNDGFTFTKHDNNTIFQADGEGFDAVVVSHGTPLLVGDIWMLFYNAGAEGESFKTVTAGGSGIGLTTASQLTGPWTPGQQVLTTGGVGEWDSGYIFPNTVLVTEDGYRMYYSGGPDPGAYDQMCGMATSPDRGHLVEI